MVSNVYVSNWGSGTVSVLDGASGDLVSTIDLGSASPAGIAFDAYDDDIYVADANAASPNTPGLIIIDGTTNTPTSTVHLPGNLAPMWAAYDPSNLQVYTTVSGANEVYAVDNNKMVIGPIPVGQDPAGVAYDGSNGYLYVSNEGSDSVSVIDGATNTVIATVQVGDGPSGLAYDPADGDMYVANSLSSSVSVINSATNTVAATIVVGGANGPSASQTYPDAVAYDLANAEMYVGADNGGYNLFELDSFGGGLVNSYSTGIGHQTMAYDPESQEILLQNSLLPNTIEEVGALSNEVVGTSPVEDLPFGITVATTENAVSATPSPSTVTISASPNTIIEGSSQNSSIVATIDDQFGNPMEGVRVTFASTAGSLSSASAVTDANGDASVTLTAGSATTSVTAELTATLPNGDSGTTGVLLENAASVSGCSNAINWQTCPDFFVASLGFDEGLALFVPAAAYDFLVDIGARGKPPIDLNSVLNLPDVEVYAVLQGGAGEAAYDTALTQYLGITPPIGYDALGTLLVSVPAVQIINVMFGQDQSGPLTIKIPDLVAGLFVTPKLETTSSGFLNLAFTISQNTNGVGFIADLAKVLLDSLASFLKPDPQPPTDNFNGNLSIFGDGLKALNDIGSISLSVITTDLSTIGPLSSYDMIDTVALEHAINSLSVYIGIDTKFISLIELAGQFAESVAAVVDIPVMVVEGARLFLTSFDLTDEILQVLTPSLANNNLYQAFTNAITSVTTLIDPNGTTIVPTYTDASGAIVLGYDPTSGTMTYASPVGILFSSDGEYVALLNENQGYTLTYTLTLNAIGGTAEVPYDDWILGPNTTQPAVVYNGMVPGGSSIAIPITVNPNGGPDFALYLSPMIQLQQQGSEYTITATAQLWDGSSTTASSAYLVLEGTQYPMSSEDGGTTFTVTIDSDLFNASTPMDVYMVSSSYPGGFAVANAATFTESGLPSGTPWSVTLQGQTQSETSTSIVFAAPSGDSTWSVSPSIVAGGITYVAEVSSGTLTLPSMSPVGITYVPEGASVACEPSPLAVGSGTTCTASVRGNSPSGYVSFKSSGKGTFSSTECVLSSAECSVSYTPTATGGQTITVAYGGDSHNPSSYGTFSLVVGPATSGTSVSCTSSNPSVGANDRCQAVVKGFIPTGTVSWSSSGKGTFSAPSCTLASTGSCYVYYTPTSGGPVTLTASYSGDANNLQSSGTASVTAEPARTVTNVICSPFAVSVFGEAKCSATVFGINPTGTITWSSSGSGTFSSKSCMLSDSSCSVDYTPYATTKTNITASYSGDVSNQPSSGQFQLLIVKAYTTTAVSCSPSPDPAGSPAVCTAAVTAPYQGSAEGNTPTGTVQWYVFGGGSLSPSSCELSTGGTCSVSFIPSSTPFAAILASYSGDAADYPSFGLFYLSVAKTTTSTVVTCSPSQVTPYKSSTCTAMVTGDSPTGSVSWSASGPGSFVPTYCYLSTSGSCSVQFSPSATGDMTITASYSGNSLNDASHGTYSLQVVKASSTTTVTCYPSAVTVASTSTCTAKVIGAEPTGKVTWSSTGSGTFSPATCTLSSGSCSSNYTPSIAGAQTITGSYAGDSNNLGGSGKSSLTVQARSSTTSVECSPSSVASSSATRCSATVSGLSPTGTIIWSASGKGTFSTKSCSLSSGNCGISYTPSSSGGQTITGLSSGDAANKPSSGSTTIKVTSGKASRSVQAGPSDPSYTVTFSANPASGGTVAPYPEGGDGVYDSLFTQEVSADVFVGYVFQSWTTTGSITLDCNTCTVTVAEIGGSGTITANFAPIISVISLPVTLTPSPAGAAPIAWSLSGCNVSPNTVMGDGTQHTIQAYSNCSITVGTTNSGPTQYVFSGGATSMDVPTCDSGTCPAFQTTYYYQLEQTFSYAVYDDSTPSTAPEISGLQYGSPASVPITETPTGYWFDATGDINAQATVTGAFGEQWVTTQTPIPATVIGTTVIHYTHQFQVSFATSSQEGLGTGGSFTVNGAPSPTSPTWYDVDSSLVPMATDGAGFTFNGWEQVAQLPVTCNNGDCSSASTTVDGTGTLTADFNAIPVTQPVSVSLVSIGSVPAIGASGCGVTPTSFYGSGTTDLTAYPGCSVTLTLPSGYEWVDSGSTQDPVVTCTTGTCPTFSDTYKDLETLPSAWTDESGSFGGGNAYETCVVSNGYVYCVNIGGGTTFATISSGVTGPVTATTQYPLALDAPPSCVTGGGYIYCTGGQVGADFGLEQSYFAPSLPQE